MRQKPENCSKSEAEDEAQTVTGVHGAEKISWLAVEEETARGTAIIHLGKLQKTPQKTLDRSPATGLSSVNSVLLPLWFVLGLCSCL